MATADSTVTYKDIPQFPGYRVGDDGSVWSQWYPTSAGACRSERWRQLKGGCDKDGYRKAILCRGGERRCVRINVLVLETFVGPAPAGMLCAHENGVRTDNRLCNLRWDTQAGNVADKRKHGTHQQGEKHGMAKLTTDMVREIRARRAAGESLSSIGAAFGLRPASVGNIAARRTWKHV